MVKTTIETPLGAMVATCKGDCLTGLWFVGQRYFPEHLLQQADAQHEVFEQTRQWLTAYFAKLPLPEKPNLAPQGTVFQQAVWRVLLLIPSGETTSYGAIATVIGNAKASQAVGGAVGHNPISILIPCHRVVGRDGALTGYAGGIERKQSLLKLEQVL